jgi:hypothetical protein
MRAGAVAMVVRCDMLAKLLYWVAVIVVSLVFVVALILFLESRDDSELENSAAPAPPARLLI